jgi:hypothetical protein
MEIRKRKFIWIEHTLRKNDSDIARQLCKWNPQGTRGRGMPRSSWRRTTLTGCGKRSRSDLRLIATDREGWRIFVAYLCS